MFPPTSKRVSGLRLGWGEALPAPRRAPTHEYPEDPKTLGQRIRKRRMDEGLRVKDLAKLLGTNPWSVSHWESDGRRPSPKKLQRIEAWLTKQPE